MGDRHSDDDGLYLRPSYYIGSRDNYRHHDRAHSEHTPLEEYPSGNYRLHSALDKKQIRSRSHPLSAYVEDEHDALKREHNPAIANSLLATNDQPIVRGEIDQVPVLIEIEENFERRFVLISRSPRLDAEPSASAETDSTRPLPSNAAESPAVTTDKKDPIIPPNNTHLASKGSDSFSASSGNDPDPLGTGRKIEQLPDRTSKHEANTCRKFIIPRIESEAGELGSSTTAPLTIESEGNTSSATPPLSRQRRFSSIGTATAPLPAAAVEVLVDNTSSKANAPELKRRKSRIDLPPIDTEVRHSERAPNYSTSYPRSSTFPEHRSRDRYRDTRDSRDSGVRDRRNGHDNLFLSPSSTKHSTNGRDVTYPEHDRNRAFGRVATDERASSGDARRTQGRVQRRSTSSDRTKHRSNSYSATDRLERRPSYKRTSKDEAVGSRDGRRSLSPLPKPHNLPFSSSRPEKRDFSPPRNRLREHESGRGEGDRDADWITQRDKERERERERAREREERIQREERKAEREKERREREAREHDKEGRISDQDVDRKQPSRVESFQRNRSDSAGQDAGHSSEERPTNTNTTTNTTLRRQNSEHRRPPPLLREDEPIVSKTSSNLDPRRSAISIDPDASTGRYRSDNSTPTAISKQAESLFPITVGSPPKDLFEGPQIAPSPQQSRKDGGRRTEDRRLGSPPSPSSSPDARTALYNDNNRPKGPRPRAPHLSNVIHNPTTPSSSMPDFQTASRTSTKILPIPIPTLVSSSAIPHEIGSEDRPRRYERRQSPERRRSPVDDLRESYSSSTPARAPEYSKNNPGTPQSYRQPAFYINIPRPAPNNSDSTDVYFDGDDDHARERLSEQKFSANGQPLLLPHERQLVSTYEKFAEDMSSGKILDTRQCPRINFTTIYRDWRTLKPFKDFLICPTCYESQFANTVFRNEFVHATDIDPNVKTNCVYGAMPWYNVAYFYTRVARMPSLNLLRTMFTRDEELRLPCSGPMRVSGRWFTIQDPVTARPVNRFTTCEQCTTAIGVLFPRLKGLLQDNNPTQHDTTNICSLYYEPDRKRLWRYIGVLESVNNEAADTNLPVDVNSFINKILDVGRYDECKRDIPVRGRKWYWMRTIPEFVVCQECFDEAVYPIVGMYRSVAGDFFKEPKELGMAACHLYSARMRGIFLRSCQTNDKDYLQKKLQDRKDIAADITARIKKLPEGTASGDREQQELLAEWRKWE
ncbi:hypothetical protein SEPCBS119000_000418 [Sporothrix epigloea]|uniref:Ser arg-related nuclear matrix protein n=1 Tax=Sporothrix epigloea TaxID=1892477 RepID=A0ABP0D554_9PEZI